MVNGRRSFLQGKPQLPEGYVQYCRGIVWQISLMAFPVFHRPQGMEPVLRAVAVMAVTTVILKFTWWNKLGTDISTGSASHSPENLC
jgi:hypothetical protein